ncbi:MAG: HNH endonuclease [Thermoplasmatota archaeon]
MCRGARTCQSLGDDPSKWSKESPLPPPPWFDDQVLLFKESAQALASGDLDHARRALAAIRDHDLRTWYIECGQNSGRFRERALRARVEATSSNHQEGPAKKRVDPGLRRIEGRVFERDHYTCRYCGSKLVAKELLGAFHDVIGDHGFPHGATNIGTHGIYLGFQAIADHVVPWQRGGATSMENLVACCWSCNYGKGGWTLEQLGLVSPYLRPPVPSDWDGLVSLLDSMKKRRASV